MNTQKTTPRQTRLPLTAVAILLVTAAVSLAWSHYKLLSQDEIFVLQTGSVSSVRQLVHIQRTTPISLDPLVYHLLAHAAAKLFGSTAFALRLPSLLGFLLMQLCLFASVRRYSTERAALVAMAFPALTATLFYSAEARPYGLLLGLCALMLICWQRVCEKNRTAGSLAALALVIALALNTHYFAILLLIPLYAAEFVRTVRLRKLDLAMAGAMVAGTACFALTLPFQHAASEFRLHYYNAGTLSVRAISQAYRSLLMDYTQLSPAVQRSIAFAFVSLAVMFVVAGYAVLQRRVLPAGDMVFVVGLIALPLFGFLLGRFVTHSFEVRYVLCAIVGISVAVGLMFAPLLQRSVLPVAAVLCVAVAVTGWLRVRHEMRTSWVVLAGLRVPSEVKAAVLASPTGRLYVQDMGHFDVASLYEPDPELRARLALVYSRENEIRFDGHDTASVTAMHMHAFTSHTIVEYAEWKREPGQKVLWQFDSGWNWTKQALAADGAAVQPVGRIGEGEVVSVVFPK